MKFDTGRFLIKNADSGNLAVLPDANHGTDLVGAIPGLDDHLKGEKVCSLVRLFISHIRLISPFHFEVEHHLAKHQEVQQIQDPEL